MKHELKCWPEYFTATAGGLKLFEIRKFDRDYNVGDTLLLREWIPPHRWIEQYDGDGYTGRTLEAVITYITDFAQADGYVVLGISQRK